MSVGTPMVRTESGSILGPDYRRIPGFARPETNVPGPVPASAVMPGDTVRLYGQDVLVLSSVAEGTPRMVRIVTRNEHGAETVHEFADAERVRVVAVGAFDR
jgi:hypothetical protein